MASLGQRLPLAGGGTVNFQANGTTTVRLDRSLFLRAINMRLALAPTVTLGNNTAANTAVGDEWSVVKQIRLKVGNTLLRTITGAELRWINAIQYGLTPRVTATLGDGATANPFAWSDLLLPIFPPDMKDPFVFSLNAPSFDGELTLEVQWGDFDTLNSSATAWTTEPTLQIEGEMNTGPNIPYISSQLMQIESIPVADLASGFRLPTDSALRGIQLRFKTAAGTADSPLVTTAATIATALKVKTSNLSIIDVEVSKLLAETLQRPVQTFAPRSSSEDSSAHIWLDFLHDKPGIASEALPTSITNSAGISRSLDQLFLTVDDQAVFTNSTDLVDLYLWRFANPVQASN
jgi:hypothetical protein